MAFPEPLVLVHLTVPSFQTEPILDPRTVEIQLCGLLASDNLGSGRSNLVSEVDISIDTEGERMVLVLELRILVAIDPKTRFFLRFCVPVALGAETGVLSSETLGPQTGIRVPDPKLSRILFSKPGKCALVLRAAESLAPEIGVLEHDSPHRLDLEAVVFLSVPELVSDVGIGILTGIFVSGLGVLSERCTGLGVPWLGLCLASNS